MSADGDHTRTIEAVMARLHLLAETDTPRFEEWNELLDAAKTVIDDSNTWRMRWLWGSDGDDSPAEDAREAKARAARALLFGRHDIDPRDMPAWTSG